MSTFGTLDLFFAKEVLKDAYTTERASFLCKLMRSYRDGHLCMYAENGPVFPEEVVAEGMDLFPTQPVIREENRYYLQRSWVYETHLLDHVKKLSNSSVANINDRAVFFAEMENKALLPKQKEALARIFEQSFSIVCGGPGTGKTYVAAQLVNLLLASKTKEKYKIFLAAPTGRAASHLQTVLNLDIPAMTLHRLLRILPNETRLVPEKKIDADLVIVDEASMLDIPLFALTLASMKEGARLVLIGDPDQLPPVEAGSIFAELAELFGTKLERSMRVESEKLHLFADGINRGEYIDTSYSLNWAFDQSLPSKLFEEINPYIDSSKPDPAKCLQEMETFRVLGALRQGPFGTDALNRQIVKEIDRQLEPNQWWAVPIMITSNDITQDLYNGSCGVLIGKSRDGRLALHEGTAYFPKEICFSDLPPFEVAFCLSIHKSQGGEFDRVLALFPEGSENFGREALYTAVTRAKKDLRVLAEENILKQMLEKQSRKNSGFKERFKKAQLLRANKSN